MKYRQLRVIATGQWLNVLFTVQAKNGEPDIFSTPEVSHRTDIARALGMPPTVLEVVDTDTDIRVGVLLPLPVPPPSAPDPDLVAFDAAPTIAEKVLILKDRVFRR